MLRIIIARCHAANGFRSCLKHYDCECDFLSRTPKRENKRGNRSGMSQGRAVILCNYNVAVFFSAILIAHVD